jgi:hypothetical protein
MMKIISTLCMLIIPATSIVSAAAADKPNILYINIDDLGIMDVGFNNPKFNTPPASTADNGAPAMASIRLALRRGARQPPEG